MNHIEDLITIINEDVLRQNAKEIVNNNNVSDEYRIKRMEAIAKIKDYVANYHKNIEIIRRATQNEQNEQTGNYELHSPNDMMDDGR